MIRILIGEDHTLVRAGIRSLLENAPGLRVIGEAADGQEAVEMARKLKPTVLVTDIYMPGLNGIQVTERLRELQEPVQILLLSMYADESLIHQALHSGVQGYILKSALVEELIWAIHAVARGQTYLSSQISALLVQGVVKPSPQTTPGSPIALLSPREKSVLKLIAEGHTSGEIAEILSISEKTVEKHRTHLMDKLDIHNVAGLVRLAIKYSLIDPNT